MVNLDYYTYREIMDTELKIMYKLLDELGKLKEKEEEEVGSDSNSPS